MTPDKQAQPASTDTPTPTDTQSWWQRNRHRSLGGSSAPTFKERRAENDAKRAATPKNVEREAAVADGVQPIAKLSLGFSSIKLYRDRVESRYGSGSIEGAKARIDSRGYRGQKSYVVIEGPHIALSVKMASNSGLVRSAAGKFVAAVNAQAANCSAETSAPTGRLDQLAKLGALHDSGILTDTEFAAEKAAILAEKG
jgi:Short C-terminal domain